MKKSLPIALFLISLTTLFFLWEKNNVQNSADEKEFHPIPTEIGGGISAEEKMREEAESQEKREAWFEKMHRAEEGTDWKAIEANTRYQRHIKRAALRNSAVVRDEETVADGNLTGEWKERGSKNQAGRVLATEYDPVTDEIWLISAGGVLHKGLRDGTTWQVVNDDLRFNQRFLKAIDMNGSRRWIAYLDDVPHYSDDEGNTWLPASGLTYDDSNGGMHEPILLNDTQNTMYVLSRTTYWSDAKLYKSANNGETYTEIHTFDTNDFRRFRMKSPHNSNDVNIMYREDDGSLSLYEIDSDTLALVNNTGIDLAGERVNFAASVFDGDTIMYTHDKDMVIYRSEDAGLTWEQKDTIPTRPWAVGLFVTKTDPNILYTGDINCYTTTNGGQTWFGLGEWWEYYDDVEYSIHADMMYFNEFETSNGERFLVISNDGGVSISNDDYYNLATGYRNIGMQNLNISQYYDVRSDLDPSHYYIYAGAQDQGFQRAFTNFDNDQVLEFDQVISGDYGHIAFSKNGDRMWMVYPGGWVSYYSNPENGNISTSYTIESADESVWIPPTMDPPNMDDNYIIVAGGSADGGEGSFLIKLEIDPVTQQMIGTNLPFDFLDDSNGEVSAIESSKLNPDRWYVATTNGQFYSSDDAGQTWNSTIYNVPGANYLYGQSVFASQLDSNTVYVAGSGYSTVGVKVSTDGGQSFSSMANGLPSTMVYEITANPNETMFFAATEAGPYVYIVAEEMWYDMSGMAAPAQTYWSVEYLEEEEDIDIIRFATYGRGIWDFQVQKPVTPVSTGDLVSNKLDLKVFPNPSTDGNIQLEWNNIQSNEVNAQVFDVTGKLVFENKYAAIPNELNNQNINLSKLTSGNYYLKLEAEGKFGTEKIVIQK